MAIDRIQIQDIVASQLPSYVQEDFPLLGEFLEQYYVSQEIEGGTYDLIQNIDQYVKVDELYNLKDSTTLNADISFVDTTIGAGASTNFTYGFPEKNGIIKIDDEIIFYANKGTTAFEGCVRGFSGITTYVGTNTPDKLEFTQSKVQKHSAGSIIQNLNILFLKEFFKKIKHQFAPGFSDRTLSTNLDQRNFVFGASSFYDSKGTDESFKILFKALYGDEVKVIRPSEFLFRPSDSDYQVTEDFVVEKVQGDPLELKNLTLFQDSTEARGTVTNVQNILYGDNQYYQISIDSGYQRDIDLSGSIYGKFVVNPKTQLLTTVGAGATVLDVDSTLGFPREGDLTTFDSNGSTLKLTYGSKTSDQFFDVLTGTGTTLDSVINEKTNVHLDDYAYAYSGINTSNQIRVRLATTLKDLQLESSTYLYNVDDTVKIQSLGLQSEIIPSKNWTFNIKTNWDVNSIVLLDATENKYRISTFDNNFLRPGYEIDLIDPVGGTTGGRVLKKTSQIGFEVILDANVDVNSTFTIENKVLKGNYPNRTLSNQSIANVQNTYAKFNGDVLVASNSLASYGEDEQLDPYDKVRTFSGRSDGEVITFNSEEDHGFYTGDAVWYQGENIVLSTTVIDGVTVKDTALSIFDNMDAGVYYVYRDGPTSIKLARSRADLYEETYITPSGSVTDNTFTYYPNYQKSLSPQKLYRQVTTPIKKEVSYGTETGHTGILVNGVEILNYKSGDQVIYGDVREIDVIDGGDGYDIITPPLFHIQDVVGSGVTGIAAV